ncbi:MAG: tetratricopeptide repeat protein [Deltaproteobacteria bacterium]|nr:tetratricopeptide repeat protein [Deltaproteobacteria bacterium]
MTREFLLGKAMRVFWRIMLPCICWSLAYHPLRGQAETNKAEIARTKRTPPTQNARAVEQGVALSRRAEQHWAKGEYAQAESLWQRALTIQERALGPEHPNVVITLFSLARLYQERGEYARAESLWQRALVIQERTLGPEHPNVAATLHNLAGLYLAKGEYGRVEPLLQRTLAIEEKALGPEHPQVATTLHSLAYFFQTKGEYERAEPLFQRALAIEVKVLGSEDPAVAATLHSLAALYLAKGDYDRAEPLFRQALVVQEKAGGPEHPYAATTLDSLAGLYVTKGDYDHAEPLFQRALAIWEKSLGPEHPNVATTLNNLAELYREKKEYGRAEPLFQQALVIWQKRLGPEHPAVATALNNLATLYREQGEYGRAELLFQRALTIWEKSLGPEYPNVATALYNLATLYREQGEYGRAEPLFQRALTIRETELSPEHPTVAATLHGLAILYTAQGAEAQAIALQTRGNDIREHYLTLLLATGSEEEKRAYLATFTDEMHFTVSLHLRFAPHEPQAARLALTAVLQRKGRVLDALTDSLATLRRHLSSDDQAALAQLATLRAQLANWVLKGPGSRDSQQYRVQMMQVEAQAQELEAQISARSAAFRAQSRLVTIGEVQQHIPREAALVEFVLYKPFHLVAQDPTDRWGANRYAAYVLRREGDPAWVDLGEAAPIDRAISQVRRALSDPDYQDVQTLARALDEQVMRPVRLLLGDAQLILLSPDGELNLLPFRTDRGGSDRDCVEADPRTPYPSHCYSRLLRDESRGRGAEGLGVRRAAFGW